METTLRRTELLTHVATSVNEVVSKEIPPLTLFDTCDRCGPAVPAYFRVLLDPQSQSYIDLCSHCAAVHEAAIAAKGYPVRDERKRNTCGCGCDE